METKKDIAIIIPSLDPDDKLLKLLADLKESEFSNLILVNDGSAPKYQHYFEIAKEAFGCHVITHCVNLGKGRALKDAFNYILTERPDCIGAVTVDSDGQHSINDIEKCCNATIENPDMLVMGCRDFSGKTSNIPSRSRFGNVTTQRVLKLLCGISLTDTQTGLRGFSRDLMKKFMTTKGERFEYEMNMIIDTKESDIRIKEVPIETIYIEENQTSHFNPLLDSARIYSVFFKFIISSSASFLIDIALFTLLTYLLIGKFTAYIVISAYGARIVSAFINYLINKNKVFKNTSKHTYTLLKYAVLCIMQITISAFVTTWLFGIIGINVTIIKVFVDIILFLLSFQIQRGWVFKK